MLKYFKWHWFDVRRFSRRQKVHFYINLLIGFSIIAFSHIFANSPWSERVTDAEFDYFIKNEVKAEVAEYLKTGVSARMSKDIVFFDIDQATYRKWGKPSVTPRDELARLLEIAADGKPKVIVLDVLLNRDDYRPPAENERLRTAITAIREKGQTKIIVPVLVDSDKELVPTIVDDYFDDKTCFRAASALMISKHDYVSRYWLPYVSYTGGIIPSVAVLTSVLAYGNGVSLDVLKKEIVAQNGQVRFTGPAGEKTILFTDDKRDLFYQRIRYHLISEVGPEKLSNLTTQVRKVSDGTALLAANTAILSLSGKIVIIGNSSPDKGDVHRTSLGDMPGMYVLGNVINTVSMGLQPRSARSSVFLEMLLVLTLAFIFVHTEDLVFLLLTLPIFVIGSYFSYLYFLEYGIFISLKFPAVFAGMGLHGFFSHCEEAVHLWKKHFRKRKEHHS